MSIGEARIGDVESPYLVNKPFILTTPITAKIVASKNAKGQSEFQVETITTEKDKGFRFLVSKGQYYENTNSDDRPKTNLALGDKFDSGRRTEFEMETIRLIISIKWERTDAAGKPHKAPILVVTAQPVLIGIRHEYKITDYITAFRDDGSPVWTPKETFNFSAEETVLGTESKAVEVVGNVPNDLMPQFGTDPIPPFPDFLVTARNQFDIVTKKPRQH